jgi:hypothetical protein
MHPASNCINSAHAHAPGERHRCGWAWCPRAPQAPPSTPASPTAAAKSEWLAARVFQRTLNASPPHDARCVPCRTPSVHHTCHRSTSHLVTPRHTSSHLVTPRHTSSHRHTPSSHQRDNRYRDDLGHAIANFARVVPDGLLVFFPAYSLLTACVEHWQRSTGARAHTHPGGCRRRRAGAARMHAAAGTRVLPAPTRTHALRTPRVTRPPRTTTTQHTHTHTCARARARRHVHDHHLGAHHAPQGARD